MKRAIGIGLCAAMVLVLWGCSDDDVVDPTELTPPSNLRVTDRAPEGRSVSLSWGTAVGDFIGYRIYAHTQSNIELFTKVDELEPYKVGQVGSAGSTATVDLGDSYNYYYVHVRAYTEDEEVSEASPHVYVIARPEGQGALIYELASETGNPSGFDLSGGVAVSMAMTNTQRHELVDFYLADEQGGKTNSTLCLWDPKKANVAYQNEARFAGMTQSFDNLTRIPDGTDFSADHVVLTLGKVIAVQITHGAVTHYAKLEITQVSGQWKDRTISFTWAYQPEQGHRELVPQP